MLGVSGSQSHQSSLLETVVDRRGAWLSSRPCTVCGQFFVSPANVNKGFILTERRRLTFSVLLLSMSNDQGLKVSWPVCE